MLSFGVCPVPGVKSSGHFSSSPRGESENPSLGCSFDFLIWAEPLQFSLMGFVDGDLFLLWRSFRKLRWSHGAVVNVRARSRRWNASREFL